MRRLLSALFLIPAILLLVGYLPPLAFAVFVAALAALSAWEFGRIAAGSEHPVLNKTVMVYAAFCCLLCADLDLLFSDGLTRLLLWVFLSFIVIPGLAWKGEQDVSKALRRTLISMMGIFYCGFFWAHVVLIRALPGGLYLLLLPVAAVWLSDTAAYYVGKSVGKHKLAPVISPNKTWEGSAAGFLGGVVGGIAITWLARTYGEGSFAPLPTLSIAGAALWGGILGVVGQFGDLFESLLKRSGGIKDSSGVIPGHGGLLDAVDGVLFGIPILYYSVRSGLLSL